MNSGTTANVAIEICGSEADSEPIALSRKMTQSRVTLDRGNEDSFTLHLPGSLGALQYLRVWHDNSGKKPAWFLDHIFVKDVQTEESWTFRCNQWFALEKGDGKVERLLFPISGAELKSFTYSLKSRNSKNFAEGHLWLSVVTKPPHNSFTRVQRATCCLSLLLSAMLANAMFYKTDKEADATIQVGPLKFSWRQVIVGIESSLIATPINLLILAIFKNSAPRKKRVGFCCMCCGRSSIEQDTSATSLPNNRETKTSTREKVRDLLRNNDEKDSSFKLPHCWVYIAWFVSCITIAVSAAFTFSYSLVWGKEVANQWLSSMLVSLVEDLFVLQPVKICLMAVILSCLFKERVQMKKARAQASEVRSAAQEIEQTNSEVRVAVRNEEELEQAREYLLKEKKMFTFGKSLVGYLIFLTLLTVVCYGTRSQNGFLMTQNVKNTFNNFSKVSQ